VRNLAKKRKEARTCHDCGLEAIDDCEGEKRHIPSDETLLPCSCCVRNPEKHRLKTLWRADFYSETWTRESDKTPVIEDPNPHECELLRTLHLIINEEGQKKVEESILER